MDGDSYSLPMTSNHLMILFGSRHGAGLVNAIPWLYMHSLQVLSLPISVFFLPACMNEEA